MRYLILSDLHSNREALQAVLRDSQDLYDRIVCCGDLAGYGADPNLVVDWARGNLHAVIRGNHDRACSGLEDLESFNPIARRAAMWTIGELSETNLRYLSALPQGPLAIDGFTLAHGSPFDEDEYLLSLEDAREPLHRLETNLVFFGHTHQQRIFSWLGGQDRMQTGPDPDKTSVDQRLDPDGAYLVNPGSVGQPRDGDPRAAWALYDTESRDLSLRRSGYDSTPTRRRIIAAGLPNILAERLLAGH